MFTTVTTPSLPFAATVSQSGDIVVFYLGPEPRMTPEQALVFADQLRELAAETARVDVSHALSGVWAEAV
ncbi:hypothetical protein [Streptosporangium sp. NPDC000396]|uniref:hypothetical protein n=1 Tax=Streptosporangium sp. NPDC000396 TaxID=3366185 RepID=UPI0036A3F25B